MTSFVLAAPTGTAGATAELRPLHERAIDVTLERVCIAWGVICPPPRVRRVRLKLAVSERRRAALAGVPCAAQVGMHSSVVTRSMLDAGARG